MNNETNKIQKFTDKERYGITDQMRRAAVSITSNIAEGFTRRLSKEKSRFYCVSQASLVELQNQLIVSKDVGYLLNNDFKDIAEQSVSANKLINGLLRATREKRFES
jgi:four helix bundle protein